MSELVILAVKLKADIMPPELVTRNRGRERAAERVKDKIALSRVSADYLLHNIARLLRCVYALLCSGVRIVSDDLAHSLGIRPRELALRK